MRLAYLTTAYHEIAQLERLQDALAEGDPDSFRFVQFDKSSPYRDAASQLIDEVRLTRAPIAWGDGSYLSELLVSLREMLSDDWDWFVLLSGQDLPVRPLRELHGALREADVAAYSPLSFSASSFASGDPEPIGRYFYRYRVTGNRWPSGARKVAGLAGRGISAATRSRVRVQPRPRGAGPAIGLRTKHHPFTVDRPCFQGSEYVVMNRDAVERVLDLVSREPAFVRHLSKTFIPTEAFFTTALRWTCGNHVSDETLHFMRYGGRANPRSITPDDRDEIVRSGKFFARKFSDDSSWVEEAFPQ